MSGPATVGRSSTPFARVTTGRGGTSSYGSDTPSVRDTCAGIIDGRLPNLFRLYANPDVAAACDALTAMTRHGAKPGGRDPSFLANGGEEALSGALKLARFTLAETGTPGAAANLLDPVGTLTAFAAVPTADGDGIEFLPGVTVNGPDPAPVLALILRGGEPDDAALDRLSQLDAAASFRLVMYDRPTWDVLREDRLDPRLRAFLAGCDVAVFDETFARGVPFGAFTSPHLKRWMSAGRGLFHSTTFQPNALAARHFLRCLEADDPALWNDLCGGPTADEPAAVVRTYRDLYSPSLAKLIRATGFDVPGVRTDGHFVVQGARGPRVFDAVAGVACSVRGHNPPDFVAEVFDDAAEDDAVPGLLAERLHTLTGLPHHAFTASGGAAVEAALKLALVAASPKKTVVVLRGGFAGKTLLALTGTERPFYRAGLGPLYGPVRYLDPDAPDAAARFDDLIDAGDVAAVLFEPVRGVGGVRPMPPGLLDAVVRRRAVAGFLLIADEIQTGMFRTGPPLRCRDLGVTPDLATLGKAASDMMVPASLTLYTDAVRDRVAATAPDLLRHLDTPGCPAAARTVLNVLRLTDSLGLEDRVRAAGKQFAASLDRHIPPLPGVAAVRSFGLLAGVELKPGLLGKTGPKLAILNMLHDRAFPVLCGFCQGEPHVLKLTPPLTATDDELDALCRTLARELGRSSFGTAATAARRLVAARFTRR